MCAVECALLCTLHRGDHFETPTGINCNRIVVAGPALWRFQNNLTANQVAALRRRGSISSRLAVISDARHQRRWYMVEFRSLLRLDTAFADVLYTSIPYHKTTHDFLFYSRKNQKYTGLFSNLAATARTGREWSEKRWMGSHLEGRQGERAAVERQGPGRHILSSFLASVVSLPLELIATGHRDGDTASVMKTAQQRRRK